MKLVRFGEHGHEKPGVIDAQDSRCDCSAIATRDEFGTVEAGKLADLLIVEGDVLADISVLERREKFLAVMQGGIVKAGKLAR